MIIGKRQIILASLVLGLGVAVFLNWQYTNSQLEMELPVTEAMEDEGDTYGEAEYVDVTVDEGEAFFVEARMSRQKARDEAVETLAVMLQEADLDSGQREAMTTQASDLANAIETEGKIENLIKAKGFADVMVYYDTQRADVIVKTEGLLANEAAQIKDIILKETSITAQDISIVEIN
jgi:stage III sporulation protein AH